ncbi:MAG: hypothetical protein AB4290_02845 [Spirulina sp.]
MTSPETPTIDLLALTRDPKWLEEAARIEDECGDFSIGVFGNNYRYFHYSFQYGSAVAERMELLQSAVEEELENDPDIDDAKAFVQEYFASDRIEAVQAIFEDALENCDKKEQMREKAKAAIAVQKEYNGKEKIIEEDGDRAPKL